MGASQKPIHIKPSHRGELHRELGVPQGERIPESKLQGALHSSSAKIREQANFAKNIGHAGKSKHDDDAWNNLSTR